MENVQHACRSSVPPTTLLLAWSRPSCHRSGPAVSSAGAVGGEPAKERKRRSWRERRGGGKKHLSLLINIAASPGERRHRPTYFHRVIGREYRVALAPDVPTLLPIQMMTQGSGSIIHGQVLHGEQSLKDTERRLKRWGGEGGGVRAQETGLHQQVCELAKVEQELLLLGKDVNLVLAPGHKLALETWGAGDRGGKEAPRELFGHREGQTEASQPLRTLPGVNRRASLARSALHEAPPSLSPPCD